MAAGDPPTADNFVKKAAQYRADADKLEAQKSKLEDEFKDDRFKPLLQAVLNREPRPMMMFQAGAVLTQIVAFLQSGTFYFFAGLFLFFYALHLKSGDVHPSLLFLLALLGVAILLFGTGSQAAGTLATGGARMPAVDEAKGIAGSGSANDSADAALPADHPALLAETQIKEVKAIVDANQTTPDSEKIQALTRLVEPAKKAATAAEAAKTAAAKASSSPSTAPAPSRDWGPIKANAAVAGGAAVLAMLFGLGIIHYSKDIRTVLSLDDRYTRIYISACAAYTPFCGTDQLPVGSRLKEFSMSDYSVTARIDSGTQIPMVMDERNLRLVLLSEDVRNSSYIRIKIDRIKNLNNTDFKEGFNLTIPIEEIPAATPSAPGLTGSTVTVDETANNCIHFEGVDSKCPLARIKTKTTGVDRGDRAPTREYSLNFWSQQAPGGTGTASVDVRAGPAGAASAGPVKIDFDLGVNKRSVP